MEKLVLLFGLLAVALGSPLDGRIIGGRTADIMDFPYMVSIAYQGVHYCGGSILDKRTILTAAHCMQKQDLDRLGDITVRAGSSNSSGGGQLVNIRNVVNHPQYKIPFDEDNDISLLFLATNLQFGPSVFPVALSPDPVPVGSKCTVSGWGTTNYTNYKVEEKLRYVTLTAISDRDCKLWYKNRAYTSTSMLCTLSPEKDACTADSGGPLTSNFAQVGIVSWGIGCAEPGSPGVYTKVANYLDWIKNTRASNPE